MSDEDNVRDEDELGENTFGSLDFESDDLEDVDDEPLLDDEEFPVEDDLAPVVDEEEEDDIDDGYSEFNDFEE